MPYILIVISICAQIICGVHAVRTDRTMPWLLIIIFFGIIGSAIYFITQMLPDLQQSRTGRRVSSDLSRAVDPDRELRRKIKNLDIAETADNRRHLAEECLSRGMYDEAAGLYDKALQPPFETDPTLMMGLARARFGQKRYADTVQILDDLRAANPDYQSSDGHLLYARALEGAGRPSDADHEYAYLVDYYPGEEARYRYGLFLLDQGDRSKARDMFQEVVANVDRGNKHYYRVQRDWYSGAKQHLRTL